MLHGIGLACGVLLLAACAAPPAQVAMNDPDDARLAMPSAAARADLIAPQGGSTALGNDFLDLAFQMENGRALPVLSRFEEPIRVALQGRVPSSAQGDMTRLISRLRAEAAIDIGWASADQPANITVDFQPKSSLRRLAPTAACFVVPGVSSLAEFRRKRGSRALDWGSIDRRISAAIFVPSDTSPQEIRDCLHEELAQAIGPLNDLYRLSDSVFNDDNFHTVLTGFDMDILRIYMAPELRSGMTRAGVAAALPAILSRVGASGGGSGRGATPAAWVDAIQGAIANGDGLPARRSAAARALNIAQGQGWSDTRVAFSHFAVGRLEASRDPALALQHFDAASSIWSAEPGAGIQLAHVDLQRATMALAMGDPGNAIAYADRALPAVRQSENAALQAMILLIKAEALDQLGRNAEADRLRLDSRGVARYGFGTGSDVEARLHEIAARSMRVSSN